MSIQITLILNQLQKNQQQVVKCFYISSRLSYKPRIVLNMYKKPESAFIKIINSKKSKIVVSLSMNIPIWMY